jgi:hypothetical protein
VPGALQLIGTSVLPVDTITKFQIRTMYDEYAGAEYTAGYTLLIEGYMDIQFYSNVSGTTPDMKGIFEAKYNADGIIPPIAAVYNINFDGTGTIAYGILPTKNPIGHPMSAVVNLNAAYYIEIIGSGPTSTTFYYTTLSNALTNSNNITIVG